MSYKQKLNPNQLKSYSKKRISSVNEQIKEPKYKVDPLDDQQGSGAILDLIFKVAPHLLAPIAEALGSRVSKFIKGEGTRLAGNGVRLAGDYSPNKPKRILAPKNSKKGRGKLA